MSEIKMKLCPICDKVYIMEHWPKCTHCADREGIKSENRIWVNEKIKS